MAVSVHCGGSVILLHILDIKKRKFESFHLVRLFHIGDLQLIQYLLLFAIACKGSSFYHVRRCRFAGPSLVQGCYPAGVDDGVQDFSFIFYNFFF